MSDEEPPPPLELLLEVQGLDAELDRLAHRRATLPEHADLTRLRNGAAALDRKRVAIAAAHAKLATHQAELEKGIGEAVARVKVIEHRLYHGEGFAFRDQEAMLEEVRALEKRKSELEDRELEVMEELEPIEAELAVIDADKAALLSDGAKARESLVESEREIDAESRRVAAEREPLAATLPAQLSAEYQKLRQKLGGVGAAKLVKGSCSGCHLVLPATELDQIRHAPPGTLFHCDQCGRLLVP